MGSKMLIDASHPEETRVVVLKGNRIEEFDFESASRRQLKGNIYLAKVTRVEPSLQAAFIEYGGNRHGFLAFSEIHPDYYQIPLADRMALIQAEEEDHARANEEDEEEHSNGNRRERGGRDRDRGRDRNRGRRNEAQGAGKGDEADASSADESYTHEQDESAEEAEYTIEDMAGEGAETASDGGSGGNGNDHNDEGNEPPEDGGTPRAEPMAATHDDPSISEPVETSEEPDDHNETAEREAELEAEL